MRRVHSRSSLTFLLLNLVLFGCWLLPACQSYGIVQLEQKSQRFQVELPSGKPKHLVVRVVNPGEGYLFIDWDNAHIRWPTGFECGVRVVPGDKLCMVYPGGSVEYHIYPAHYYLPADSSRDRRASLDGSLVPDELYRQYEDRYHVTLFVPVFEGEGVGGRPQENCCDLETVWEVETVATRISKKPR